MSASEIFAELPKLSHEERRRLAAAIFDLEEEAGCFAIVIVGLTNTFACWMRWKRNVAKACIVKPVGNKARRSDER